MSPITTADVIALSGATETDIKNWRRRKVAEDLPPGERGRGTDWEKSETLVICFTKALVNSGLPAQEASNVARYWLLDLRGSELDPTAKKFARFYARNIRTGETLLFGASDITVADLLTTLSDDIPGGWVADLGPVTFDEPAIGIVIIDREGIQQRVEAAFGKTKS